MAPLEKPLLFHGPAIHSLSPTQLEVVDAALLVVDTAGRIAAFDKNVPAIPAALDLPGIALADVEIHVLPPGAFLMPGLVDAHNHAPQWAQRGLGQGMHILDWLDTVTFPNEARFADAAHARRVYAQCVAGLLRQGTTTAAYFASAHGAATRILADTCLALGQRALVGKCNMDRNAPAACRDASAAASLADTAACVRHIVQADPRGDLVRPVLTPRFAITCTPELLAGLGALAAAHQLPVQTHFNEAAQEMAATRALFPQFGGSEADLYEHYGLLGARTILAHCCHMGAHEVERVAARGCGVAHCPAANMTVGGGFMAAPVRRLLRRGVKVGLGTDSGGGWSSSMLDAMRLALVASNARAVEDDDAGAALGLEEVFYMATLGGARVCGVDARVGRFAVGMEFDACLVDAMAEGGVMTAVEPADSLRVVFEKFVMTADDRNIARVYVRGRRVK